jgi:hypothetical protein
MTPDGGVEKERGKKTNEKEKRTKAFAWPDLMREPMYHVL